MSTCRAATFAPCCKSRLFEVELLRKPVERSLVFEKCAGMRVPQTHVIHRNKEKGPAKAMDIKS
jgi:hypothetical protein